MPQPEGVDGCILFAIQYDWGADGVICFADFIGNVDAEMLVAIALEHIWSSFFAADQYILVLPFHFDRLRLRDLCCAFHTLHSAIKHFCQLITVSSCDAGQRTAAKSGQRGIGIQRVQHKVDAICIQHIAMTGAYLQFCVPICLRPSIRSLYESVWRDLGLFTVHFATSLTFA